MKTQELLQKSIEVKNQFDELKKEYKDFFHNISKEKKIKKFDEFPGKRTPKIVMKLFNYPGDISPAMLLALAKEITENKDFYEKQIKSEN